MTSLKSFLLAAVALVATGLSARAQDEKFDQSKLDATLNCVKDTKFFMDMSFGLSQFRQKESDTIVVDNNTFFIRDVYKNAENMTLTQTRIHQDDETMQLVTFACGNGPVWDLRNDNFYWNHTNPGSDPRKSSDIAQLAYFLSNTGLGSFNKQKRDIRQSSLDEKSITKHWTKNASQAQGELNAWNIAQDDQKKWYFYAPQ